MVQHLDVRLTFDALAAGALSIDGDKSVDTKHSDHDEVGDRQRPGSGELPSDVRVLKLRVFQDRISRLGALLMEATQLREVKATEHTVQELGVASRASAPDLKFRAIHHIGSLIVICFLEPTFAWNDDVIVWHTDFLIEEAAAGDGGLRLFETECEFRWQTFLAQGLELIRLLGC